MGKLAKAGLFLAAVIGFTTIAPVGAMAWKGPCDIDYSVKSFAKLNKWAKQTNMCVGPLKINPVYGVSGTPKTKLSPESDFSDAEPCKIRTDARNSFRTFTSRTMDHPHPSINTRYLFLPFTSPDMPQSESPWSGYSNNFNYIKDWLTYINDSDQKQTFTFEKTPVKLSFNVTKFDVNHGNKSGAEQFAKVFVEEASKAIDFSKYDIVLVMPPAGTPRTAFAQGFMGRQNFGNTVVVFMAVPPATYTTQFVPHFGMISPHEWMHELYHAGGFSIQHHNGNDYWQNGRPGSDKFPGLGEWGLMNMSKTDLLGWEKWFLGYTKDSQVACLNPNITSTVWIKPDGVKNASKKLAVLPISPTKVMVFQSVRDYGVNYKLGPKSQGLLVWTVDTTEPRDSYGVDMVTGKDRKLTKYPFVYYDAPLKKGEKVTAAGFEIKVLEAGKYGDVFSVSKTG